MQGRAASSGLQILLAGAVTFPYRTSRYWMDALTRLLHRREPSSTDRKYRAGSRARAAIIAIAIATLSCSSPSEPATTQTSLLERSTVSASPASLVANGQSTGCHGHAARRFRRRLRSERWGLRRFSATNGATSGLTDKGDGTYTATLTSSTVAGLAVVSARLAGAQLADTAGVDLIAGPASLATVASASANNQSATVGLQSESPISESRRRVWKSGTWCCGDVCHRRRRRFLAGTAQTTNAAGIATAGTWTPGISPVSNSVTATISGIFGCGRVYRDGHAWRAGGHLACRWRWAKRSCRNCSVSRAFRESRRWEYNPVRRRECDVCYRTGGGSLTGAATTTNASGIATVGAWTSWDGRWSQHHHCRSSGNPRSRYDLGDGNGRSRCEHRDSKRQLQTTYGRGRCGGCNRAFCSRNGRQRNPVRGSFP